MELLWQDLRRAARSLLRAPAFTIAAVITLALGIGANTAVFSIVNAALLRALPYPRADRLVRIAETHKGEQWVFSPPNFVDLRAQTRSFDGMAAGHWTTMTLTGAGDPVSLDGFLATDDFFHVLRVQPALGRVFTPAEFASGQDHVVILSHELWRDRLGSRADAIGTTLRFDGEGYTVVGVLPSGVEFPRKASYWVPLAFTANDLATQRGAHYLQVLGRIRDGVTPEQAEADAKAVATQLAATYPSTNQDASAQITGLRQALVGDVRTMLLVLLGTVSLVLLLACTNVANLVLARASGRTRDVAISLALGATGRHLIRRSLAEALLLATLGGGVGVLAASWLTSGVAGLHPGVLRNVYDVSLDPTVLMYTVIVGLGTALLFGVIPVWRAGRAMDLDAILRGSGRGVVRAGASWRLRGGLVAVQLALAVMLLAGAGLLTRSFLRLQEVDAGFSTANGSLFRLTLPGARYGKPAAAGAFYVSLFDRLRALPGVTDVSATSGLPLDDQSFQISVRELDGVLLTDRQQEEMHSPQIRLVTPGYLGGLHVAFVRGRDFTAADGDGAPLVAIVNEAAARLLWKDVDPVGHHLEIGTRFGLGADRPRGGGTVVGVVRDVRDDALSEPPNPTVYFAHAQFALSDMAVVMHTTPGLDARALVAPVRDVMRAIDVEIPPPALTPLEDLRSGAMAQPRFAMLVIGFFAVIALALAAVGIYGVMSGLVAQRESEIGIRMALGAARDTVVRETIAKMVAPVAIGVTAGLAGAFALTRVLASLLYQIAPSDPLTLASVTLLLLLVALAASYLPARRASRTDPMEALRAE